MNDDHFGARTSRSSSRRGSRKARATAARLTAVQALHQSMSQEQPLRETIAEYKAHRLGETLDEGEAMVSPDAALFGRILEGVGDRRNELQACIAETGEQAGQETVLQSILLCGASELVFHLEMPAPVIISDYMYVTEAFFDDSVKKLVNAKLDAIAKNARGA